MNMEGIRLIRPSNLDSINSITLEGGANLAKYPYARAYPEIKPNRWPKKLDPGTKMAIKTNGINGVAKVGRLCDGVLFFKY